MKATRRATRTAATTSTTTSTTTAKLRKVLEVGNVVPPAPLAPPPLPVPIASFTF
jgi:hypothetical protein